MSRVWLAPGENDAFGREEISISGFKDPMFGRGTGRTAYRVWAGEGFDQIGWVLSRGGEWAYATMRGSVIAPHPVEVTYYAKTRNQAVSDLVLAVRQERVFHGWEESTALLVARYETVAAALRARADDGDPVAEEWVKAHA